MKTKYNKKIISGVVLSLLSSQVMQAMAQGVSTQPSSGSTSVPSLSTSSPSIPGLPNLTVLDPAGAPAGCSKEIMANLNTQYLNSRTAQRQVEYNNQVVGLVTMTPKTNQMDCFQQAMQNIKQLLSAINSIIAMFSGEIDMDAIMQQIVNMVLQAACQEINQVTGSVTGSLNTYTNGINSTVGGITNTQVGVGGVSTSVGSILNSGNNGYQGPSAGSTLTGMISGSTNSVSGVATQAGNTVNNATTTGSNIVDKVNSVSPFGSQ